MQIKKLLFFVILIGVLSCKSDSFKSNYTKKEMLGMARAADPTMEIKIGTIDKALIDCKDYKYPCRTGYLVIIKGLEMKALYYDSQNNAIESARRLKAYRARNWVFDNVRGEPILERFVKKNLKAEKMF